MKNKNIIFLVLTFLFIGGCQSSVKIENFYGKTFSTYNGRISFEKKTDDYSCIYFDDASVEKISLFSDTKILDNPKIESISGKKYLVLEGIKKNRFEIKSEELILDTENNKEYKLVQEQNFEKETKDVLGKEYYTKEKDGYIKIVKKTEQYSFIDLKVPDSYFTKKQLEDNQQNGFFIISDRFDFPKVYIQDKGVIKFLNAENLETNRLMFLDDDNQILDTYTNIRYFLNEKTVVQSK